MQVELLDFLVQNGELTQSRSIQTAYTPRRQKTGSAMQVESPDLRSHSIQTACTPTHMAAQQEEDNGRQERRKKSSLDAATPMETAQPARQLKPTYTAVDASSRPDSGRATTQCAEERTAMEEELSTLQLTPEKDLQSPTITSRQQECRIEMEAVIEQKPRGKSSALEISNREQPSANKPEIAD